MRLADTDRHDPATDVRGLFRRSFRQEPEGEWSAPGRVNFIGEHTDYNAGFVLPFAIAARAHVAVARTDSGVVEVVSAQQENVIHRRPVAGLAPENAASDGWAAYIHGVLWALRDRADIGGVRVAVDSTVPPGAGLSSSAALECAVTLAVRDLWSLPLDGLAVARVAQTAEAGYVGVPCGLMDQMASSVSHAGAFTFFDTRDETATVIPVELRLPGLELLLIDTKVKHSLTDGEYATRRQQCEQAAAELGVLALRDVDVEELPAVERKLSTDVLVRRTRHVVTENQRVRDAVASIRSGDLAGTGPLLTASHASLRDDFEVSTPELDTASAAAIAGGALGARVTGGGFGGSVLALVPNEHLQRSMQSVRDAFRGHGFGDPALWTVTPAAGAHRDD